MLGILLPRHWNTVIRQSYLPWIMYWMPRNMNHRTAGNLVCFKQTQLPNPNSFCYKTCLIKNIYMKLPFGGFELQVWLSYWLCFNTQMKAFYFPTFLFFLAWSKITALAWQQSTSSEVRVRAHGCCLSVSTCTEVAGFRNVNTDLISAKHHF